MSKFAHIKSVLQVIWFLVIGVLIIIAVYSLFSEEYAVEHFSYGLKNGKYKELKESEEKKNYPSIFHLELNEMGGRNKETWIDSKMAFSTSEFRLQKKEKMAFTVTSGEYWPTEYQSKQYEEGKKIFSDNFEKVKLSTSSGSHLQFPLENLKFSISIKTAPTTKFKRIEIYNRTPGLLLESKPKILLKKDAIEVKFNLRRRMYDQILFYFFTIVNLILVILFLVYIKKKLDLTVYASGFFIALWSVRGIFSFGIKAFPSYLDYMTLTLSMILLVGIVSKAILGCYEE